MSNSPHVSVVNKRAYVAQWGRNRKCVECIDRNYNDWQLTIIFYTALHAINAAAAHLGLNPTDHSSRNTIVKTNESFAGVREKYLLLYRLSQFTRYDPDPETWVPSEFLNMQALADDVLRPIETQIDALIGSKLNLQPVKLKS